MKRAWIGAPPGEAVPDRGGRLVPTVCAAILLAALGCAHRSKAAAVGTPVTDRDWVVIALGVRSHPVGSDGRRITLRLDSATSRASGFAGCNQYTAPYRIAGDTLTFGAIAATRMACADGDEVEQSFLTALSAVRTYHASDGELTLDGATSIRFQPYVADRGSEAR